MDDRSPLHARARQGVNMPFYWLVRAVLQPFFHLYFGVTWKGRKHIPQHGPAILAANHRSFSDPFIIALLSNRPLYFVAKRELFDRRFAGWCLNLLGAFPIDRGNADGDAIDTARMLLEQGNAVLIFPEGTRVRTGGLGRPKRGVGQLAVATGAPVVPIAISGTERLRKKWMIVPGRVRMLAGSPVEVSLGDPSPEAAQAVVDRVWPNVELQWEWLGGAPRVRRAVVLGDGAEADALTALLPRADVEVGAEVADETDLVVVTGRAADAGELIDGIEIPERAHVLVACTGTMGPEATGSVAHVQALLPGRPVAGLGHGEPAGVWEPGRGIFTVGCADRTTGAVLCQMLRRARCDAKSIADPAGLQLVSAAAVVSERPLAVAAG